MKDNEIQRQEGTASVATKIRAAREAAQYSLEDLAVTCGLSIDELSAIESGGDTDDGRLRRVANALKIELD